MRPASIALLLFIGCSSGNDLKIAKPEIALVQLYGPGDLGYARGSGMMLAEFGVQITNKAMEPITLRRIELSSVGTGSYVLRREDRGYKQIINSGETAQVRLTANAYYQTDVTGTASREPVLIRAIVYFDAPSGAFRQFITRHIEQFSQGPR